MKYFLLVVFLTAFGSAAETDVDHAARVGQKRLELVAALSDALDDNAVCIAEAYPSEVVEELAAAKLLVSDEVFKNFLATIKPDAKIRRNFAFRAASGQIDLDADDVTETDLTQALENTTFYHFARGALGSEYEITFRAGGKAEERTQETKGTGGDQWTTSATTWSLVPKQDAPGVPFLLKVGDVEFRLEEKGNGGGVYWWVPNDVKEGETDYLRTLSSEDSYCDA